MMLSKSGKGSVGGGQEGEKAKTTPDAGGKSVSEKSQVTRTCKNPFEKNARTALGCDDAEEEDDTEDEEHREGPSMLQQECKTRWSSTQCMGGMLQQECKTRWSSTHATGDSLMTMTQFPHLTHNHLDCRDVG
jgi:hypothetical protein